MLAIARRTLLLVLPAGVLRAEVPFSLVTEEEAIAGRTGPPPPMTRAVNPGAPRIEIEAPDAARPLTPPLSFRLRFIAPPDAEIDPASFRALYGFFGLDITDRLRQHARIDRAGAVAENVAVPSGEHRVVMTVTDTRGRTGRREHRFTVT